MHLKMKRSKQWLRALRPVFIYSFFGATILGWWALGLRENHPPILTKIPTERAESPVLMHQLSPLDRDTLKQALAGDYALMTRLIADWEVDARILNRAGVAQVKELSSAQYLQSQLLGRELASKVNVESKIKVLPQTYVAASFLLALTQPEQIIALPTGLRKQEQLYPKALTSKIPLDVDRHNAEKLYEAGQGND